MQAAQPAGPPTVPLSRGAITITIATAVSRITGFVRVIVVAGALGTTFLANTYQTANTAPNLVFELAAAGVLTSVFVPTFVEFLIRGQREKGWEAANALASVGLVALIGISLLVALLAAPIVRLLTLGVDDPSLRAQEIALGARFLRLFAPQIVFYGLGMIMTAALHAHRRFAVPAIAPIFNNLVVIAVYLAYAVMRGDRPPTVSGITAGEVLVLGLGTTMGVVAMTLCLAPSLARIGWRIRFRWNPGHPAVRRGARLGSWALGYAGGYQLGLIVVLALANQIEGGVAAYQWAFTFFYLPHALFGVPIFSVLFTTMSEKAAADDLKGLGERLRDGLRILLFILMPVAVALFVLAIPISVVALDHGVMGRGDAAAVGRVLAVLALGLPSYSAFLVLTRAFYAVGETRVPALVNALAVATSSVVGAILFWSLDDRWRVPGLAAGHTIGFLLGAIGLARLLSGRIGVTGSTQLRAALIRSLCLAGVVGVVMAGIVAAPWPGADAPGPTVVLAAVAGGAVYAGLAARFGAPELRRLMSALRGR